MTATKIHNIEIASRYNEQHEIAQMTEFVNGVHSEGLSHLLESLFYDSKNCYCTFAFRTEAPDFRSADMLTIHQVAKRHIMQFIWDGRMDHGLDLEEQSGIDPVYPEECRRYDLQPADVQLYVETLFDPEHPWWKKPSKT